MVTIKQGFYLSWLALAVIVRYDLVPPLITVLETSFDLGILTLTIWSAYTYIVLVYTSHLISKSLNDLVFAASRSNVTTILAGLVVFLGICTLLDVIYAYLSDSELFLVQMLYNAVTDPSGTAVQTMSVISQDLGMTVNSTIANSTSVNVTDVNFAAMAINSTG